LARPGDHLDSSFGEHLSKLVDGGQVAASVKRPLSGAQYRAASERFEAPRAKVHCALNRLFNRFSKAPTGGMIEVLVITEFGMVGEIDREPLHVNGLSDTLRPGFELIKFSLG